AAPFARRVFLSFPIAADAEGRALRWLAPGRTGGKYHVTGRPIPARSLAGERTEARRLFGLPESGPVLLVFGGSQGAERLNELALSAFAEDGPAVLHLAGRPLDEPRPGYRVLPYT